MAKRSSMEDKPAYRGVIKFEDPRTQKTHYKYIGPYQSIGAARGQITAELSHQEYFDKYYPVGSANDPRIVAVGIQEAAVWTNVEDWTEIE